MVLPMKRISIEGCTASKGRGFNLELSKERVETIGKYFIGHGINAGRLFVSGYGEMKPVGMNDTLEETKRNRRVEIYFVREDQKRLEE